MVDMRPITSFMKSQRIQWLGYFIRWEENDPLRAVFERKPQGKRPHGLPWKRLINGFAKYLKAMGIENWKKIM